MQMIIIIIKIQKIIYLIIIQKLAIIQEGDLKIYQKCNILKMKMKIKMKYLIIIMIKEIQKKKK